MKENELQKAILDMLRKLGHWAIKAPAGLIKTKDGRMIRMGDAGQPDIITGIREKDVWIIGFIEVKLPHGELSFFQKETLKDHDSHKRRWLIADSVDDVLRWLNESSYHGKKQWMEKLHNERQIKKTKTFLGNIGFKGTQYELAVIARDEKIKRKEIEMGAPPF